MKKLFYILCCSLAVLFTACEGEEPKSPEDSKVPATSDKVETGASSNVTGSSAILKGVLNVDILAYEEIEFGIMYSTSSEAISNRTAETEEGKVLIRKEFEVELCDLKSKTKYYYCAYLLFNEMQYEFGEMKEFITKSSAEDEKDDDTIKPGDGSLSGSGVSKGHEYVDLGLSVKWSTMNVGATSPEDYGDYFAWGETITKSTYNYSTYKWCNGSYNTQTKYCTSSSFGKVDNKTVLDLSDDAANANWGGGWRMPTKAEQDELLTECTWTWTNQNGINGHKVTSKVNGNSIFLPAAGYRNDSDLNKAGSYGYYWSSSLFSYSPYDAYSLYFYSNFVDRLGYFREIGLSVRPVLP